MCKAAVVTGATGFLGSQLVAGILGENADVIVICLARPKDGYTAWERVVRAVARAYRDRNGHDEPAGWAERVIVVEHDLGSDGVRPAGVTDVAGRVFEIGEFWHCAAAVEFAGERGGHVWRANVDGLRNALAIADKFGARVFNHISTAYVAGKLTCRIAETLDSSPRSYININEESKHVGEHYVARHRRLSKMTESIHTSRSITTTRSLRSTRLPAKTMCTIGAGSSAEAKSLSEDPRDMTTVHTHLQSRFSITGS